MRPEGRTHSGFKSPARPTPPSKPPNANNAACCVPPRCAWWPYIWSLRTPLKVGPDGRVPVGHQRLRVGVSAGTCVIHCLHPNGSLSILAHDPKTTVRPALLLQIPNG